MSRGMKIASSKFFKNFSVIPNYIWTDQRLSLRSKIVAAYLAGRPEDSNNGQGWIIWRSHIQDVFPEIKNTSYTTIMKELINAGYVNDLGTRKGYEFYVFPHENEEYDGEMPSGYEDMVDFKGLHRERKKKPSSNGDQKKGQRDNTNYNIQQKNKKASKNTKKRKANDTVEDFDLSMFD